MELRRPEGASYEKQVKVRGTGFNRLQGIESLYWKADGARIFDIGCNRGAVGYDLASWGASLVHGCDIDEDGLNSARGLFADLRNVESRFERVDLTEGPKGLQIFGAQQYDITLCLATYHKLKRLMRPEDLTRLVQAFGGWTRGYFAWRATSDKHDENDEEMRALDRDLGPVGLSRIHTSYISGELGVAAIWARS